MPPAEAWTWLLDIERIATCLPGAELTEVVDAQTYKGKVGVRLGPVSLSFVGQAKLEETDAAAHRARMRATGADSKGRGSTAALIDFSLQPLEDGATTRVNIHSNVTLTGSVAQYGRGSGMIQSVAAQLIGQFGECLRARILESRAASAVPAPAAATDAAPSPSPLPPATPAPAKPISGFSLLFGALLASLRNLFGRKKP
ncbi:MAG: SRPBCC family protein [Burkholderiales bacterium]|nr:SRPBCC family protein [Burkholderiales bacterium]